MVNQINLQQPGELIKRSRVKLAKNKIIENIKEAIMIRNTPNYIMVIKLL
jgi:hypothetical protein